MKIYNDESPLDLAVRPDLQPPAMTSLIVETLDKVSLAPPQSGLHQLAAAAELKQQAEEEEMMLDLSSPDMMETGGQETPRVCCSPVSAPGSSSTPRLLAPPSPDSAIHSTIYSPSQSPGQSRHGPYSGFSSPYPSSSHKTSPSLSRNNSDVSQYSLSPSQSPVTSSRYSLSPGYPSPAIPSSPLSYTAHPVILPRNEEQ